MLFRLAQDIELVRAYSLKPNDTNYTNFHELCWITRNAEIGHGYPCADPCEGFVSIK